MGGGARGGGSGTPSPATSGVGFSGAGFRNARVCINWRKALAKTLFSNEKRRKLKEATGENVGFYHREPEAESPRTARNIGSRFWSYK
jgi:hypothetical protein